MPATSPNVMAYGNIRPSRFCKPDTDHDHGALEADANERVFGISMEGSREAPIPSVSTIYAAQSGDSFKMYGDGEECLLELGGTVGYGDLLKSDADGKGVAIATSGTTLQHYGARALTDGASGELIRVQIILGEVYPALA